MPGRGIRRDVRRFASAARRCLWQDSTCSAIAQALRQARRAERALDIAELVAVARKHKARLDPVLARFGWLRSTDVKRAWVQVDRTSAGSALLPTSDVETLSAFALWRGVSGRRIVATVSDPKTGRTVGSRAAG
jgi:hypothetical protein